MATGVVDDVLVLAADGRRPQPRGWDVLSLGLWSVPDLVAGALLRRVLPKLRLATGGGRGCAVRHWTPLATATRPLGCALLPERWWSAAPAGLAFGVLSTATTLGESPVVLYLTRRSRPPRQTRDTLVALSLVRLPLSVAALVLAGTWVRPPGLLVMWTAEVLGYVIAAGPSHAWIWPVPSRLTWGPWPQRHWLLLPPPWHS